MSSQLASANIGVNERLLGNMHASKPQSRKSVCKWIGVVMAFVVMAMGEVFSLHKVARVHVVNLAEHQNTTIKQGCLANPHRVDPVFGSEGPKKSNYCYGADGELHWYPMPHCELPPPEPFWLDGLVTTGKGVGMGLAFWTNLGAAHNKYKDYALMAFASGSALVSVSLLIYKAYSMGGFEQFSDHAQCWGTIMSFAPWAPNAFLYFAKIRSGDVAAEYERKVFLLTVYEGPEEALQNCDQYRYQENIIFFLAKTLSVKLILLVTIGAFIITNGRFLITNLIPSAFMYIWATVPAMALFGLFSKMTGVNPDHLPAHEQERFVNISPMFIIPCAIIVGFFVQWLATTSVYRYQGYGYLQAAWVSSTERRSSIYFAGMVEQIFKKAPWLAEFVNEVFP